MTGIKWWRRVIFYAELNFSGHRLPRDFSNDTKPKIDPCGHTTPSNHVAIFHDSRLFGGLVSVMAITKRRNTISLSPGIVTFDFTGRREHSSDGAFPQLFGWLLQSGQVLGGELYQGGGARKF